jgi:hypothetical protein
MKTAEEFVTAIACLAKDTQDILDYEREVGYFPTYVENLQNLLVTLEQMLRP